MTQLDRIPPLMYPIVLSWLCQTRTTNGLNQQDYDRYRKYCTRRIHRLKKTLKLTGIQRNNYFLYKTNSDMSELSLLELALFHIERIWSTALALQAHLEDQPSKKRGMIKKFLTGTKILSTSLDQLHSKNEMDHFVKLQLLFYYLSFDGYHRFEDEDWTIALRILLKAKILLSLIHQIHPLEERVYNHFESELLPRIRFSLYQLELDWEPDNWPILPLNLEELNSPVELEWTEIESDITKKVLLIKISGKSYGDDGDVISRNLSPDDLEMYQRLNLKISSIVISSKQFDVVYKELKQDVKKMGDILDKITSKDAMFDGGRNQSCSLQRFVISGPLSSMSIKKVVSMKKQGLRSIVLYLKLIHLTENPNQKIEELNQSISILGKDVETKSICNAVRLGFIAAGYYNVEMYNECYVCANEAHRLLQSESKSVSDAANIESLIEIPICQRMQNLWTSGDFVYWSQIVERLKMKAHAQWAIKSNTKLHQNPDQFVRLNPASELGKRKLIVYKLFKSPAQASAIPAKPWVQDLAHEEGFKISLLEQKLDDIIEPKNKGFLGSLFGN